MLGPIMNTLGPPEKKVLWIQFFSSVTQSKALKIFFHFWYPMGKRSCEFSPFRLSTCTLILHWKLQNNLRIFSIFCKKGIVWKDRTFFEENNVAFSKGRLGPKPQNYSNKFFGSLYNDAGQWYSSINCMSNEIFVLHKFGEMSPKKSESLHQFNTCRNIEEKQ